MSIEATIKQSLAASIANFGYPVGMGLPPPDEALDKMTAALLAALGETHVVGLLNFFAWAMRRGPWEGGDLDGGGIQDKAESLGLIVKEPYDPAKHGEYIDCEVGDDFFVFAPAIKTMIAAVTSPDRGGAPSPELPIISD